MRSKWGSYLDGRELPFLPPPSKVPSNPIDPGIPIDIKVCLKIPKYSWCCAVSTPALKGTKLTIDPGIPIDLQVFLEIPKYSWYCAVSTPTLRDTRCSYRSKYSYRCAGIPIGS